MAVVDSERDLLVLRIVYDGPAMSGKTTSLRALADGWDLGVTTPEEQAGRTLYFDWVDYVGGLFDGRQIRCQLVGVPGQRELAARRKLLLEEADAVVFVLDSRRECVEEGAERFGELLSELGQRVPHVGVVLQANKRDAPSAIPRDELARALRDHPNAAVLESVATTGEGIREAFVFAVRLALDRVRELARLGKLETVVKLKQDSADDLLCALQATTAGLSLASKNAATPDFDRIEAFMLESIKAYDALGESQPPPAPPDTIDDAISRLLAVPRSPAPKNSTPKALGEEYLFSPDPMMPGGHIWPPVDGRALLHEVSQLAIQPERTARGDWWASGSGWRFHSLHGAAYSSAEEARSALISWSRLHAMNVTCLSGGRTVILAEAGPKKLRLWQLMRVEQSLRESLATIDPEETPGEVAEQVLWTASRLLDAREEFLESGVALPCTLWTVGAGTDARPAYVGLMPFHDQPPATLPSDTALLSREFEPVLRDWKRERRDFDRILQALVDTAEAAGTKAPKPVFEWIRESVRPLQTG